MPKILGNILFVRGDSYPLDMWIKDKGTKKRIDITDYTFILTCATIKDPPDDTAKLFSVTGTVATDQVADIGKVTFTPTSSNTDQPPGTYYYDIQMTYTVSGNTYTRTIAKYDFTITQDITK